MIGALKGPHAHDSLGRQTVIAPDHISVVDIILVDAHLKVVFEHFTHDRILRVVCIDYQFGVSEACRLPPLRRLLLEGL